MLMQNRTINNKTEQVVYLKNILKRVQLKDDKYLKNLIIYVHLNPMHHLNQDYLQFRFSSYQTFLSDKETQVARAEVVEIFDNIENFLYCHSSKQEFLTEIYTLE